MSEFVNDFLMVSLKASGLKACAQCSASNAAEDDLSELASLVSTQSTLKSANGGEDITLVDEAPALEFDLEAELAKAFQTGEAEPTPEIEFADLGLSNLFENADDAATAAPAPTPGEPSVDVPPVGLSDAAPQPVAPVEEMPVMAEADPFAEFSDAIAEEFDKALAEEVAGDADLACC